MKIRIGGKPKKADQDIAKEIQAVFLEEIGDRMPVDIDFDTLKRALERQLNTVYRQAFKTIATLLVGRAYSPNSPEIRNLPNPGAATRMPGLGSRASLEGGEAAGGVSRSVLLNLGLSIRRKLAPNVATNLRRDLVLNWKPLHPKTLKQKEQRSGDAKRAKIYYVDTGALQEDLQRLTGVGKADDMFKVTVTSDSFNVKGKKRNVFRDPSTGRFSKGALSGRVKLGTLQIELLPNLARYLPGIYGGNIAAPGGSMEAEAALGLSGESITKLQGRYAHRPLIKPVLTYYTLFEAPIAVERAIRQAALGPE